MMKAVPFLKMHGLGNDFVVFDARKHPLAFSPEQARQLANRKRGIGCDQLVIMEPSAKADVFMRIRNADGGEVESCGNASRCVAWLVMRETGKREITIDTLGGLLHARWAGEYAVSVDMGAARLEWQEIPLATQADTLHMPVTEGALADPVGVSMGNPHAVFFVPDAAAVPLEVLGPKLEHHALFLARANIGVAQVRDAGRLTLRVWERGVGETEACGTGACAAAVAAARRGLTRRQVAVELPGGELSIDWQENGHVLMTGPVALSFSGVVDIA